MPRIVFLSDTHGFYDRVSVPPGDILIHSGDFGPRGTLADLREFHAWFAAHPHPHKVFVAGNHDWCFQEQEQESRTIMREVIYLQDESAEVLGVKVYGSPWQPWFLDWAFNLPRGKALARIWAKIPADTDVLVTHSPPHGILDTTEEGQACGCADLLERIELLQPKLHLFGHIHEGYGTLQRGAVLFVNGAVCDRRYRPVNPPHILDL